MTAHPFIIAVLLLAAAVANAAEGPIRVLLIDGQNNHDWKATTPCLKAILDKAGGFQVTVSTTPAGKDAPQAAWDTWRPAFRDHQCVLLNYNGVMWPEPVRAAFVDFVQGGGGVVLIHAANNAFGGWKEYEKMVGLLWRWWTSGYSLYVEDDGTVVREDPGKGRTMGHGDWAGWHDWTVTVRDTAHPITQGMPLRWLHTKDELYHGQRGPAEDVHILLTAYSEPGGKHKGTGRNEPVLWWVPFGKGRVVTNVMGHAASHMQCVGFQAVLERSCAWAATGRCDLPLPARFPTATATSIDATAVKP